MLSNAYLGGQKGLRDPMGLEFFSCSFCLSARVYNVCDSENIPFVLQDEEHLYEI